MKTAIIIPTYNERENIKELIPKIFNLAVPDAHVVIVDDNSPDKTAGLVREMKAAYPNLHLLERKKKDGLGKAYLAGFKYALEQGADFILEMDADLSHDYKMIPVFLDSIKEYDLVVGSRYIPEGRIENWNYIRQLVSRFGNFYARTILGVPVMDLTTGYKCYRRKVVEKILGYDVEAVGYVFQIETSFIAIKNGFSLNEIPIVFTERKIGKSKFNLGIIWESFWKVLELRMKR